MVAAACNLLGFLRSREQDGAMYAGNFAIPFDTLDVILRLVAATLIGIGLGLERMLRGKATGMRTMGLVSFAAALVTLSTMHAHGIIDHPDALSRVLQGVEQGVLVGIGFLGGGILMRDPQSHQLFNLTIAAEVWAVAAMGLATACAPWVIAGVSIVIFALLMVALRALEKSFT
jgi:putative Mg2+ transporter-C (MgtC) family protein